DTMTTRPTRRVRLPLVFFALATLAAGCFQQTNNAQMRADFATDAVIPAAPIAPQLREDPALSMPALSGTPTANDTVQVLPNGNVVDGAHAQTSNDAGTAPTRWVKSKT